MSNIRIGRCVLGSVGTNCYFVYNTDKKEAVIIDPADKGEFIKETMDKNGLKVIAIFLTHGHFDHILGTKKLKELTGAKVYASKEEKEVCEDAHINCSDQTGRSCTVEADTYLEDGAHISLLDTEIKVIVTPGHTKGSTCYYFEKEGILISGDTLFQESVGRADLPTGSMGALVRSIKEKLFMLPEDVQVYPGHGDSTSIGYEKQYNPFCQ